MKFEAQIHKKLDKLREESIHLFRDLEVTTNPVTQLELQNKILSCIHAETFNLEPIREVNRSMCKSYNRSIIIEHQFR